METSIFPVFYTLHGTYSYIFTILGPAHNFLYKFKHQPKFAQKEKENGTLP